jgi:hypothetical protein
MLTVAASLMAIGALIVWSSLLKQQLSSEFNVLQHSAQALIDLRQTIDHRQVPDAVTQKPGRLVEALSGFAEAHKAQITALTLDPEARSDALNTEVLDMKGSYPAIKALLADIFNANDRVALRQLTLRRTNQSLDIEGRLTFVVKTDSHP